MKCISNSNSSNINNDNDNNMIMGDICRYNVYYCTMQTETLFFCTYFISRQIILVTFIYTFKTNVNMMNYILFSVNYLVYHYCISFTYLLEMFRK